MKKHAYEFKYTIGKGRNITRGTWIIKENTTSEAKKRVKDLLLRKYKQGNVILTLVAIDQERKTPRRVKAIGLPTSIKEVQNPKNPWEERIKDSPHLLKLAQFADIKPSGLAITIMLKESLSGQKSAFLKLAGTMSWSPLGDLFTITDPDGDVILETELSILPKWIDEIIVGWPTTIENVKTIKVLKFILTPGKIKTSVPEAKPIEPRRGTSNLPPEQIPEDWDDWDPMQRSEWLRMSPSARLQWLEENEYYTKEEGEEEETEYTIEQRRAKLEEERRSQRLGGRGR